MKFLVVLEEGEDGYIVAECPVLPRCVSQERTTEEALANIREAGWRRYQASVSDTGKSHRVKSG